MKKILLAGLAVVMVPVVAAAFEPVFLSESEDNEMCGITAPPAPFWKCFDDSSGSVVYTMDTAGIFRVLYPEGPCPETASTSQ